jgi:hypothetical protein
MGLDDMYGLFANQEQIGKEGESTGSTGLVRRMTISN